MKVIICGAGMAGIALAHQLSVGPGNVEVVLIDEREPLGLTSSRGTEAYRDFWPAPEMRRFMTRSIDRLDALSAESGGAFELNRRGYVYLTSNVEEAARFRGFETFEERKEIRHRYPFLSERALAMFTVPRAGWMNVKKLASYLLERAQSRSLQVMRDRVTHLSEGSVPHLELASGARIEGDAVVLAAGPLLVEWTGRLGLDFPIRCERHGKIEFRDPERMIPRDAPLMIWNGGVHFRPRGDDSVLGIWTYDPHFSEPSYPLSFPPRYRETVLAALAEMVPALERYLPQASEAIADGGYYCKAPDNRPLLGPTKLPGVYLLGALSGFGVMASQAAAELVAAYLRSEALPDYAAYFAVDRPMHDDPFAGQL